VRDPTAAEREAAVGQRRSTGAGMNISNVSWLANAMLRLGLRP
jgi:hypothetical protein